MGGYIGEIRKVNGEYKKYEEPKVVERLEENIKAVPIGEGANIRYLVELPYVKEYGGKEGIACYKYITSREELDNYRNETVSFESGEKKEIESREDDTLFIDSLDMDKLRTDKNYNKFVANEFLTETRIEKYSQKCPGYIGGVYDLGEGKYQKRHDPIIREALSTKGINGEEKVVTDFGNYYIRELGVEQVNGKEINKYEIISSDQMARIESGMGDTIVGDRIIVRGNIDKINNMNNNSYINLCQVVSKNGGYIGYYNDLEEEYSKDCISIPFNVDGEGFVGSGEYYIWKQEDTYHISRGCSSFADVLDESSIINGNLDVARMKTDPEYNKFVRENVLTEKNLEALCSGRLRNINIKENENGFELESEDKRAYAASYER